MVIPVENIQKDNSRLNIAVEIEARVMSLRNDEQAAQLMRFFKCREGDYGEGDRFLGLRVPQTRAIVKEYRNRVHLPDCVRLVSSPWHEIRLAGFLLMKELYRQQKKKGEDGAKNVVDCYISSIHRANNWDLVDLSADLLGDWLLNHPPQRNILDQLSDMQGALWHQRVAMVANWILIRNGEFDDTFRIAQKYLTHTHDLIHKATGWMLREVGKRGGHDKLCKFLDKHAASMPRTMLRYAIEKFPETQRQYYLKARFNTN